MKRKFPKPGTLYRFKELGYNRFYIGRPWKEPCGIPVGSVLMFISHKKLKRFRVYKFLYKGKIVCWANFYKHDTIKIRYENNEMIPLTGKDDKEQEFLDSFKEI